MPSEPPAGPGNAGPTWPISPTFPRPIRLRRRAPNRGQVLPLCRLRYGASASRWGFAIYLASRDSYADSILPNGQFAGSPEDALDCACGLYLNDPTAWRTDPSPTN